MAVPWNLASFVQLIVCGVVYREHIGMAKTTKAGGKAALSKKGSEAAKHLQTSKPEKKSTTAKKGTAPDKK
jgi:hypothetical protein